MDNFTPLKKSKEKKKINKLLIFGNLFLAVFVAVVGILYYNGALITTQQKAEKSQAERDATKQRQQDIASGALEQRKEEAKAEAQKQKQADKKAAEDAQEAAEKTTRVGQGIGSGKAFEGGWKCQEGKNGYSGGPCLEGNSIGKVGSQPPNCFCGIIQIDGGENDGTYKGNCGCGGGGGDAVQLAQQSSEIVENTPTPTPTGILTSTPTPTIVPTVPGELTPTDTLYEITPTITPTPTITQLICATKDCNETTRPCQPGNTCIKANNGSNYCSNTSLIDACKSNPTDSACCKIVPTSNATPTEIIVAKVSVSPTAVVKLLKTGATSFIYLIPSVLLLIGLLF